MSNRMNRRQFGRIAVAAAALPFPSAFAQLVDKYAEQLTNGEFNWYPDRSTSGPIIAIVSLPDQRVYVYRDGVRIAASTCSTGKLGHRTRPACSRSYRRTRTTIPRPITMRPCRT
jgi:hypothetical protein